MGALFSQSARVCAAWRVVCKICHRGSGKFVMPRDLWFRKGPEFRLLAEPMPLARSLLSWRPGKRKGDASGHSKAGRRRTFTFLRRAVASPGGPNACRGWSARRCHFIVESCSDLGLGNAESEKKKFTENTFVCFESTKAHDMPRHVCGGHRFWSRRYVCVSKSSRLSGLGCVW
jgi:hypothetical protein